MKIECKNKHYQILSLSLMLHFLVILTYCTIALATATNGETTWYIAEGSTANGFETWICVLNPNNSAAELQFTYADLDGNTETETHTLNADTRYSRDIAAVTNMNDEDGAATKVESTNGIGIVVEGSMYCNNRTVATCSLGARATANKWYHAEGSTSNNFETWVSVFNPDPSTAAILRFTYADLDGNTETETHTVSANTRYSRDIAAVTNMADKEGVATEVESTNSIGVVVEGSMYQNNRTLGTRSIGAIFPAAIWYLAEGSTANDFETWICVYNPNVLSFNSTAQLRFTYMDLNGGTEIETYTLEANTRYSRNLSDVTNMNGKEGVSTKVESTTGIGIVVQRSMYWSSGVDQAAAVPGVNNNKILGTSSIGSRFTAATWYLAEGSTASDLETWICVLNPNPLSDNSTAQLRFTYMDLDGETEIETTTLEASTRYSRNLSEVANMNGKDGVSTIVESTNNIGIVVERAMYCLDETGNRKSGHASLGVYQHVAGGPDPDYDNITWTLPTGASPLRLSLPADIEDFLFDSNGGIGGYGIHAGGHIEGLDHPWIEFVPGTPAKSWADGIITNVQLTGDVEAGEHQITIDYGYNLIGVHMEIATPYVAVGDTVTRGQEIGMGMSADITQTSGEMSLYDKGRTDNGPYSTYFEAVNASPFDYLRDEDKQTLVNAYKTNVLDPYVADGTEAWGFQPEQPYLTNTIFIHDDNPGKLTGAWYLTSSAWAIGYPNDILTFNEASNTYFTGNVVRAQDRNQSSGEDTIRDGTFVVNYTTGQVIITDPDHSKIYYGIFEIDESSDRAILTIEYQEGSYPASFTANALTYQERTH